MDPNLSCNLNLAKNIKRYRKERGLTQEQLARSLGVSFQAVSKWENGKSMPDVTMLSALSVVLQVSIDALLGYVSFDNIISRRYDKAYRSEDYFWGVDPDPLCMDVLRFMPPGKRKRLIEIGCGEGKDCDFFARTGYDVTGVDISTGGLKKARLLAQRANVNLDLIKADIVFYQSREKYDIYYSSGALHLITSEMKQSAFEHYKKNTYPGGIHAISVKVDKPFLKNSAGRDESPSTWYSGELLTFYRDWKILFCEERIKTDSYSGQEYQYAVNTVIAQKVED